MAIIRPGAVVPPATARPTITPTRGQQTIGAPTMHPMPIPTRTGRRFLRGNRGGGTRV